VLNLSSGDTFAIATARSASVSASPAITLAETLATFPIRRKTRSEKSSLSEASVPSTLPSRTDTLLERDRTTTASAASAPEAFRGLHERGGAVDQVTGSGLS
jgi:hypothetical protein